MSTEIKRSIYDHLAIAAGIHLPMDKLDEVTELILKRREREYVFDILCDLEEDPALMIYKDPSMGAYPRND
jgi:hypothetical protein